ncbi:adaptin N terminal region-domain-containing protein [Terfezia claveryi]|nr:adaptin N terminal region-domain-containing protein [Terfezia claveryi]
MVVCDRSRRFEKSLYDLIRGLRARKGDERAYILENLKECRNEARSQDGDIKATAILKLIYLEMFGHDMSWASFHVLEVMSSAKFLQKRIGYLAAIQSFTLHTDVLMLATNLLKKDLSSSSPYDISLAINGLSHIVSPSLARDLSPELITKMNHSNPYIRKKAILVMYKCFLQSPELLRTAWPRLREGLNDGDPSVVNATVNVICELARKNPRNYLPLAPQLFGLLTGTGNNWMTIKIIKLFATLTPLEPRLTKKLVPPITNLIKTTTAMSLLYECINGLISGGLLAGMGDTTEGEELASVCVTKLRGFLVEGDSNLKYVGLLAFTKIVSTHAHLVALHQDVILDCIDDPDITIRLRSLELVLGMVTSENLQTVVARLMRQLRPPTSPSPGSEQEQGDSEEYYPSGDEDTYTGRPKKPKAKRKVGAKGDVIPSLPESYKVGVIRRILEMCSRDMYANILDFGWYLDVLVQLVRFTPPVTASSGAAVPGEYYDGGADEDEGGDAGDEEGRMRNKDVGEDIGFELRNVAVRVKSVRAEAVGMADLLVRRRDGMFPAAGGGGRRVLLYAGWMVGEYSSLLSDPESTLGAMIQPSTNVLPTDILAIYIQALPKIYATVTGSALIPWTPHRQSSVALFTNSIIRFLEPHATSPDLEVQERTVEFLELFRLAAEAIAQQGMQQYSHSREIIEPPRILTQAIPEMFVGQELNPVAPKAQKKVPLPPGLDLDEPINPRLHELVAKAEGFDLSLGAVVIGDSTEDETDAEAELQRFYYQRFSSPTEKSAQQLLPASAFIDAASRGGGGGGGGPGLSYQHQYQTEEYLDKDILERRRAERRERNANDPFYIGGESPRVGASLTPNPLRGEEVDVDAIPVMPLDLGVADLPSSLLLAGVDGRKAGPKVEVVRDEEVYFPSGSITRGDGDGEDDGKGRKKGVKKGGRHPLLGRGAGSGLVGFSLDEDEEEKGKKEEVRRARREVERIRKEMEERRVREVAAEEAKKARSAVKRKGKGKGKEGEVEGGGVVEVVKKKKKKKAAREGDFLGDVGGVVEKPKVKKVKKKKEDQGEGEAPTSTSTAVKKKKKKKEKAEGGDVDEREM